MNNVILIGRLTADPRTTFTTTGKARTTFTLAVDRPKKGDDVSADFPRIVAWGATAETCDKYLAKGRQVAIVGRITTGSYKDKDGSTVYTTEVTADRVEFLGSKPAADKLAEDASNLFGFSAVVEDELF